MNNLAPLARRLGNMIARGAVAAANAATKMQTLQLRLMEGETKDGVEHFEPFGFTSKPLPGAEHVTVFVDGDRSHGITIVVADRRFRLQGLAEGEAALHDAFGNKIHLQADGTLAIVASAKVQITTPLLALSGNLTVGGTVVAQGNVTGAGKSLATHTHSGVQTGGGNTGAPN